MGLGAHVALGDSSAEFVDLQFVLHVDAHGVAGVQLAVGALGFVKRALGGGEEAQYGQYKRLCHHLLSIIRKGYHPISYNAFFNLKPNL